MKKLLIVSALFIASACSASETRASLPDGYTEVSHDDVSDGELTVVRHSETGCYYTYMDGTYSGAFTQMFIEKNGVSVPYCN